MSFTFSPNQKEFISLNILLALKVGAPPYMYKCLASLVSGTGPVIQK